MLPGNPVSSGDVVRHIIYHPSTSFGKWKINEQYIEQQYVEDTVIQVKVARY